MHQKNNSIFIGIDVSKTTLDISIAGKHFKINNTAKDISVFIKTEISTKKIAPCLVCLESTGGYEKLAMQIFQTAKIPVHKAHPNKIHAFAKASGHFAKTDKLDASLLEKFAAFVYPGQKGDAELSKTFIELQELRSIERHLMEDLHRYECRLEHVQGRALQHLEKQIEFIKQQIAKIRKDIVDAINSDEELMRKKRILKSYQGVGEQVSHSLLSELPELGGLNKREIASLVGVAPKLCHSGKKTPGGHIFGGRFFVRKAIYMAALVASRYNERMRSFYERLVNSGKPKKLALTAVMRKIIVCLNAMLKNNSFYA